MTDCTTPPPAIDSRQSFPSLLTETRHAVDTATAAFHLGRQAQTLRKWACLDCGPLRPVRVNRRLAWVVADIKRLLEAK
ncbi:DNA-binding protein [Pseudoduganella plicata]|uniref:DNA-binding protein n=1 Tax=Pseudoduganella plicata TaxID=321984 RepID=A0ABX5SAZ2_9BURK|nr:DNA-binding protein [Pseudoduganella plicata]